MIKRIAKKIISLFVREKITPVFTPIVNGRYLENKVALVIGGSGGIGSGIAKSFVENGCSVIISGTNVTKLNGIKAELGENCRSLLIDTTDIETMKARINEAFELYGKIDILVYASGVHCKEHFGEISESQWDNVIDINLKGMYFACQEFANHLIATSCKGHILTVSSASCAKPGWTPYEISKAGVRSLTLGLADRLVTKGIIVNSIAPGPVSTPMLGKQCEDDLKWCGNPTGRMATVEEVANLAVFMVSEAGDLVVGDTFFLSGGSGTICIDR